MTWIYAAVFICIVFPHCCTRNTSCPFPTFVMPLSNDTKMKPSCYFILSWVEIALFRKEIMKDRPQMKDKKDISNPMDMRADNKSHAMEMCRRSGELHANNTRFNELHQYIAMGIRGNLPVARYFDLNNMHAKNLSRKYSLPKQTNAAEMDAFLTKLKSIMQHTPYYSKTQFQFFLEKEKEEAASIERATITNQDWDYPKGSAKSCGYFEVSEFNTGVHWLDCNQPFKDTDGSSTEENQIVICQFEQVKDCEPVSTKFCLPLNADVCKLKTNHTTIWEEPLGKACPFKPTEPPDDELKDCPSEMIKECVRHCEWSPWSSWGRCELGECVPRARSKIQLAWFEGADCFGPSEDSHWCRLKSPLGSPVPCSKQTRNQCSPLVIVLVALVTLIDICAGMPMK